MPGRGDGTGRGIDAVGANMGSNRGRGDGSRGRGGGRGGQPQRNFVPVSAKLKPIGIFLGANNNAIHVSYNALRRIEADRAPL